jgi:hypothetical protein
MPSPNFSRGLPGNGGNGQDRRRLNADPTAIICNRKNDSKYLERLPYLLIPEPLLPQSRLCGVDGNREADSSRVKGLPPNMSYVWNRSKGVVRALSGKLGLYSERPLAGEGGIRCHAIFSALLTRLNRPAK